MIFGDLYLKGATESKIAEEEELKREIKFSGLEDCSAAAKIAVETSFVLYKSEN